MSSNIPKIAGIYITRKCNLNCGYCNVYKRDIQEMGTEDWIKAINILDNLGIEKLVILGGEPTVKPEIEKIVDYIVNNTKMDFSIVSNGAGDLDVLKRLGEAGLQKFSSSIDTISGKGLDFATSKKSKSAMIAFEKMKEWGVEHLTAYLVLSAVSMPQVVDVVKYLSARNVWLYVIPYHYGKSKESFWETRDKGKKPDVAIEEAHLPSLIDLCDKLIEMKKEGYLVANSEQFIRSLPEHIINLDWHCMEGHITELRIDADGTLMCCNDLKGERSSNYTIFDIDTKEKFLEYQQQRDKDTANCPGCLWPSQYQSVEDLKKEMMTR